MLDPAILRIDLPMLFLARAQDRTIGPKDDRAGRGRTLVYA
jgi:hypothetical protein